jgi:N-methylhydantoinase B
MTGAATVASNARVDPITLEVVRNALVAMVMEMTDNLIRTAYSPIAAEIKDFSVGILDADGDSIAQAPNGVPMFCADLNSAIKKGLVLFAEEGFQDGDIVLSNDAETNGQHLNNMVVYSPIMVAGEVVAFAAVRSHWIDVGGMAVGSLPNDARDIFSEGIQIPFVKAYRAGTPDEAILRLLRTNSRFPELVMGDMRAQISACRLGERRFLDLVGRYGRAAVMASIRRIWDEAETAARRAVEEIPDGVYEASCVLDNDGIEMDKPIPLKVRVVVAGSDMTIDFSGMSPPVKGPCNSRAYGTIARVAFKYVTTPRLAINEGGFRNLAIVCPEGTILSAPPTAPMGWFNMAVVSTIDLVIKALHGAIPGRLTAGNSDNIGMAAMTGVDPRTGRLFQTFVPYIGGWGAQPRGDGVSAVVSLVQGDVRFMPVEVQETVDPVRVTEFSLRADSGGAGKYRGGLGAVIAREMLTDCLYSGRYERTLTPPWGRSGGHPGAVTRTVIRSAAGGETAPPLKCEDYPMKRGDAEVALTGGGGGFGPPWERDPELVRRDVVDQYVTLAAARHDYGVVIDPATLAVDADATAKIRRQMRSAAE